MRVISIVLWLCAFVGAMFGGLVFVVGIAASQAAPQQAAVAGIACALAVVPYVVARAWSELIRESAAAPTQPAVQTPLRTRPSGRRRVVRSTVVTGLFGLTGAFAFALAEWATRASDYVSILGIERWALARGLYNIATFAGIGFALALLITIILATVARKD